MNTDNMCGSKCKPELRITSRLDLDDAAKHAGQIGGPAIIFSVLCPVKSDSEVPQDFLNRLYCNEVLELE